MCAIAGMEGLCQGSRRANGLYKCCLSGIRTIASISDFYKGSAKAGIITKLIP